MSVSKRLQGLFGDRQLLYALDRFTLGSHLAHSRSSASHSHSTLVVNVPDAWPPGEWAHKGRPVLALTSQSDRRLRGVTLSFGHGMAVFAVANGSDDLLRRWHVYFTSQTAPPLFIGAETARLVHAFPQEGICIKSDSGCLWCTCPRLRDLQRREKPNSTRLKTLKNKVWDKRNFLFCRV